MEPLASGVVNSLFPKTRSCVRVSRSISRKLKSRTPSFCSNFFTPAPRDVKGKGREVDAPPEALRLQVQDCRTWACSNSRHSVFCQSGSVACLTQSEVSKPQPQQRTKRSIRRYHHRPLRPVESFGPSSSSSKPPQGQRRHVTSQALAATPQLRSSKPLRGPTTAYTNFRQAARQREWTAESIGLLEGQYEHLLEVMNDLPQQSQAECCFLLAELLEGWCIDQIDGGVIKLWGKRLCDTVEAAEKAASLSKRETLRLLTAAHAFQGDTPQAIKMLPILQEGPSHLTSKSTKADFPVFTAIFLSAARFHGLREAFQLYNRFVPGFDHRVYFAQSGFGRMVVQSPNIVQDTIALRLPKQHFEVAAGLIIRSYLEHKLPMLALECIRAATGASLNIPLFLQHITCKGLARLNHLDEAESLFSTFVAGPDNYEHLKLGLYLASRKGEPDQAEKYFSGIKRLGTVKRDDTSALLSAYSKAGDVKSVKRVFDEFFPMDHQGNRSNYPNEVHYSAALYAHSLNGDPHGVAHWLRDMQHAGLKANVQIFTTVVQTFARLGDLQAISTVLNEMESVGVSPSAATYTVIISYFAKRKDSSSAQKIYEMAIEKQLTPDAVMTRALLDAYAESGDWKAIRRLHEQLSVLPLRQQPGIEVYNIILKAYVAVGAPFPLVSRLFDELKTRGFGPDRYTYATFIQSACTAQRLNVAVKTHRAMVLLEKKDRFLKLVSVQSMTTIMHSLLAIGDRKQAKLFYDQILARGFKPSATTFTSIIKAYGYNATMTRNREGLSIAEDFVDEILTNKDENWKSIKAGRKQPLNQLFAALMSPHVYRADIAEVERLYQKFIEAGGQDSVGILSNLLEVYRRGNLLSKAMAIWPQITALAEGTDFLPGTDHTFTTGFRSIQSPFSAYIDILSRSGNHDFIIPVWRDLENKGLIPDSNNWNHLVVALIRAAQPVRAFQIIEQVLLVNEKDITEDRAIVRLLDLDLTPAERLAMLGKAKLTTPLKPLHGSKVQVKAQVFMKHFFNKRRSTPSEYDDDAIKADFTYPLRVMEAIKTGWNEWRPHNVALRYCLIVLLKLQQGHVIQHVPGPIRKTGDLTGEDVTRHDPEAAQAMLKELEQLAPNTVERVKAFRALEQKRFGLEEYNRRYIWR